MFEVVEGVFKQVIRYSTLLMEAAGMIVILVTAATCFIGFFRRREGLRVRLAEGISLALLFKMGGEVLRTVIVHTWDELAILAAIIVIRGLLTFLLSWEIRSEKAEQRREVQDE